MTVSVQTLSKSPHADEDKPANHSMQWQLQSTILATNYQTIVASVGVHVM